MVHLSKQWEIIFQLYDGASKFLQYLEFLRFFLPIEVERLTLSR